MKVKVVKSFASRGRGYRVGEVIDLPKWADWLVAGIVEALEPEPPKTTRRRSTKRKATKKKDSE